MADPLPLSAPALAEQVLALLRAHQNEARRLLARLEQVTLCGKDLAVEAARNFRRLRSRGAAVRGTIDVVIETRCLVDGFRLLHSDRDFEPFVEHLGLRTINCGA